MARSALKPSALAAVAWLGAACGARSALVAFERVPSDAAVEPPPADAGPDRSDEAPSPDAGDDTGVDAPPEASPDVAPVCDGGLVTLASTGGARPGSLTIDDHYVYFTTEFTGPSVGSNVLEVDKCGGPTITLATESGKIFAVTPAGDDVYWARYPDPDHASPVEIHGIAKTGGTASTLATLSGQTGFIFELASNATGVYWAYAALGGSVMGMPLDGGAPTTLAVSVHGEEPTGAIAADDTTVFWGQMNPPYECMGPYAYACQGLRTIPSGGGTTSHLASSSGGIYNFVVGGGDVYWFGDGVLETSIEGGAPVTLTPTYYYAPGPPQFPANIAVGAGYVDWTSGPNDDLVRIPVEGGVPATLVADSGALVLAADSTGVYWMTVTSVMKWSP